MKKYIILTILLLLPVSAFAATRIGGVYDKTSVGLANVDNTSDANKPISTATQNALDGKLSHTGSGAGLTGITAAQVGAVQSGRIDNEVYATAYNGGALDSTSINAAITAIGSSVKTLVLTPGTWAMSSSISIPVNVTLRLQPGAVINRTGGTLTVNGPINFPRQQCLSGFISGSIVWGTKIDSVYVDWQALADGSDDFQNIQSLIGTIKPGTTIHFGAEKSYNIGANTLSLSTFSGGGIHGHGSRIYGNNTSFGVLSAYNELSNNTGQNIAITKDSAQFSIPGGIALKVGDMVKLIPSTPYVYNYYAGHMASIISVSGSTAIMDLPPLNSFTATTLQVFTGVHDAEIRDLIFDSRGATTAITTVGLVASNTKIVNCKFLGADNAAAGLSVTGNNIVVENAYADGYLNKIGITGGRMGYGISATGDNITINHATVKNCKHDISLGGDRLVMSNNNRLLNSFLWQDPAFYGQEITISGTQHGYVTTALDAHSNLEQWEASGNTIIGASVVGAVSVRNGKGVFTGNTIRQANTDTNSNIFIVGERPISSLVISGNTISADTAGIPLVRSASTVIDAIATASPFYITEKAVKYATNEMAGVTWKGCVVAGDRLFAASAPTTYTWELNDVVYNSNQTAGAVIGWRCVSAGTPGAWEAISAVTDAPYDAVAWNGDTSAPSKNAVRDKIESMTGSFGEANTASNVGTGTGTVFKAKSVADLQFKSIKAGSNITIINNTDDITIAATGGGNMTNTGTSAAGQVPKYSDTTGAAIQPGYTVGSGASNLVQLDSVGKLPAVDGSQLTNLPALGLPVANPAATGALTVSQTLGDNLVVNGDFASGSLAGWDGTTNWSYVSGAAKHTPGSALSMTQTPTIGTAGQLYKVSFTISGMTAGGLQMNWGGVGLGPYLTNGTVTGYITAASSVAGLSMGVDAGGLFDGSVDNIIVQAVTGGSIGNAELTVNGAGGVTTTGNISINGSGSAPSMIITESADMVGQTGSFSGRRSRGTPSTPTAVQANDALVSISGIGYGTSGWLTASGYIQVIATENYTTSAKGAYLDFATTATGTTSRTVKARLWGGGGFSLNPVTANHIDPGAGNLSVNGSANSANLSTVQIGKGAFDGATTGYFVGSSNGTKLGVNAESGFTGDFVNYQLQGSSKAKLDYQGNLSVSGDFVESNQTEVTDANLTVTGAISGLILDSTNAAVRTIYLPATLPAGLVSKTVVVTLGAAATNAVPLWSTVGAAGSVSFGDAGNPTFTAGKSQDIVCRSRNAIATTTAAWRCFVAGGTF